MAARVGPYKIKGNLTIQNNDPEWIVWQSNDLWFLYHKKTGLLFYGNLKGLSSVDFINVRLATHVSKNDFIFSRCSQTYPDKMVISPTKFPKIQLRAKESTVWDTY